MRLSIQFNFLAFHYLISMFNLILAQFFYFIFIIEVKIKKIQSITTYLKTQNQIINSRVSMLTLIIQRKFQILGIFTLISGVAGIYVYNKRSNKKQIKQKPQALISHISQVLNDSRVYQPTARFDHQKICSIYSQYYFDKNLQCRKVLDHLDRQGISVQTIYKYSPIIGVDEYNKFTKEIRRRRRLIRTINQDQYISIVMNYQAQLQELLQRCRDQIINDCEIDPQQFQNMKHVFETTQDLSLLIRNAKKYLKQLSHNKKREIKQYMIQRIIKEQTCFIKSKVYDRLRTKLQNDEYNLSQDQILKVIQALIDDIIYEKYGYQRQEIELSLQTKWNKQLPKETSQLKKIREQLQSDIGNFNLLSQQSDNDSQIQNKTPSQQLTWSGNNSIQLEDDEQN